MTISNQSGNNIDEGIDRAAMASMFNLRNVFELIHHTLNDGSLPE